jgi:hypothetical protein
MCVAMAMFFIGFGRKIASPNMAKIIRYGGIAAMIAAFLAVVTSFHDIAITVANLLGLVSLFYFMIFVFRSKLRWIKILSIVCILTCYFCIYIYYTRTWLVILPVTQKITFLAILVWFLALYYFTKEEDFRKSPVANVDGAGDVRPDQQ